MRHVALNVQAIFTVLTEWLKESPGLSMLALVPEAERENLPHLQQVCRDLGIPLAGGIFPALVHKGGFKSDGVWLIRFEQKAPVVLLPNLVPTGSAAAEKIAQAALALLNTA